MPLSARAGRAFSAQDSLDPDPDLYASLLDEVEGLASAERGPAPARRADSLDDVLADHEITAWFSSATGPASPTRTPDATNGFDWESEILTAADEDGTGPSVVGALTTGILDADVLDQLEAQHSVHSAFLYEHEPELVHELASYVERGLSDGDLIVLGVTPHQRALLSNALPSGSFEREVKRGRIVVRDAAEMLARSLRDGVVDGELFERHVATPFRRLTRGSRWVTVYGETAPLLWSAGDVVGALLLERLWSDLQRESPFSLLCAYPAADVVNDRDGMHDLCRHHTPVHAH